ncbi:MAG: ABC transporter substrate-binding protein [Clostridiales bacterium]|jgi:peptide/nickel transport system substrate-binding protein|nr:ABC transporter substrate-binding protein [Bacillota bacterium]NLK04574.1 ABC transporter substrate-binding protein [Clostridiales bacterium]
MRETKGALYLLVVIFVGLIIVSPCTSKGKDINQVNNENKFTDNNNIDNEKDSNLVKKDVPLVVGYLPFNGNFNPFFAVSTYDMDVVMLTGVSLFTTDRTGGIVFNGIEGETIPYNGVNYTYNGISNIKVDYNKEAGITTYNIKIRDDVKFSDGHVMDADDIIFTFYILADKTYDGNSTLYSQPIIGMQNYRDNSTAAENITVEELFALLENPSIELYDQVSEIIIKPTLEKAYLLISELYENEKYIGLTQEHPVQKDLFASLYSLDENYDSYAISDYSQVIEDISSQYGMDYKTLGSIYAGDDSYFEKDVMEIAKKIIINEMNKTGKGNDVHNIEGIKKISNTEVQVVTKGYDPTSIYQIGGIIVAPLHYYGDEALYDYENNMFGFTRGDLSKIREKTSQPLGAGPYKFIKYENKIVYLEANEHYYKDIPKTKYLQLKETLENDKVVGIEQGTIDITDCSGSKTIFEQIGKINGNGQLSGSKIITSSVDKMGYGYIGINAALVNVSGEPGSEPSKNLRKAIATVLSVYRDVATDTYYGDSASLINYPISNTSWAAPQISDPDYKLAFSDDVDGNPIYTPNMSLIDKYAAALQASLGFFEAAGYTVVDGKITEAPPGAKMEYEIIIPGGGDGNHPAHMILVEASAALETIGFKLRVTDIADQKILSDKLNAGTQELWCLAWTVSIDPDMYQRYHSSNIVGKGGTSSNYYHLIDPDLDSLIMEARTSDNQSYRKATYKLALDIIMDWAVELPNYQRQNFVIVSTDRINIDTITPDITSYYHWYYEIEKLELK